MTVAPRAATAALLQVDSILAHLSGRPALSEVCRFLHESFRHYRWVGVYRRDGTTLVLEAWVGPAATEHTRIPIDEGVCGLAAREDRTVVVDDVRAEPAYLACFLDTRAEIVVPIRDNGAVVGEIDIDANEVQAFNASDRALLEKVAVKLAPSVLRAAGEPVPPM